VTASRWIAAGRRIPALVGLSALVLVDAAAQTDPPAPPVPVTAVVTDDIAEVSAAELRPLVVPIDRSESSGVETIISATPQTTLLLTRDRSGALGYVALDDAYYVVETVDGQLVARQVGGNDAPPGVEAVIDDVIFDPSRMIQLARSTAAEPLVAAEADHVVDIVFFYDEDMVAAGETQAPHLRVQAAIDYVNAAFVTHQVPVKVRAVYVGLFPGDFTFDPLVALTGNQEVAAIADQFGADLVHGIYRSRGQNYCGVAYLLGRHGVSSHSCGDLSHIIAHEIGHNFGMNHDRANAGAVALPGIGDFNYGFVCHSAGTIMSYPGSPRLPFYSSPSLFYQGEPCGIAVDEVNAAFNAHVLTITAGDIAALRAPPESFGTVSLSAATDVLDEEQAIPLVIELLRTGDLSRQASVSVGTISDTAIEGVDFESISTRVVFDVFEDRKTLSIVPIDDDDFDPSEFFDVVLRYPLGVEVVGDKLTIEIRSTDPDRGQAHFGQSGIGVWETQGALDVEVLRSGNLTDSLSIGYETFDISASAGSDYEPVSGELTFGPGEALKKVTLSIIDDDHSQGYLAYRQFGLRLTGSNIAAPSEYIVSIFNDDLKRGNARFDKSQVEVLESHEQVVLRVTRTDGAEGPLRFNYTVAEISAAAGRHFNPVAGSVQFAHNQRTSALAFWIGNDSLHEGDRTFRVTGADDAGGPASSVEVTIKEDDPDRGTARFVSASVIAQETGDAVLDIVRSGPVDNELVVLYRTEGGSAQPGADYASATGTLSFAAGQDRASIRVGIVHDSAAEPTETFRVVLVGAVSTPSVAIVSIIDASPAQLSLPGPVADQVGAAPVARSGGGGAVSSSNLVALVIALLLVLAGDRRRRCG